MRSGDVSLSFNVTIMGRGWRYHHFECKVGCDLVEQDRGSEEKRLGGMSIAAEFRL